MELESVMRTISKIGLVGAGYVLAFVIASAVVAAYVASASAPDRQLYAAMYSFGDSLLFLAVFAVAAVPASGAALYFLRPYPRFWNTLATTAIAIAVTGFAALINHILVRTTDQGPILNTLAGLAVLRFFAAPVLALFFLLSALFASTRYSRIALYSAAAVEMTVFVYIALLWFRPLQAQ